MKPAACPITRSAFTLVEALFASAVLGLVVLGLTQSVVSGQAHTYNALHEERALALAEALMEEVVAQPVADRGGDRTPGPDAGETGRGRFDGVDDFDGFTEAAGAVKDPAGVLQPAKFQAFSRSVSADYGTVTVPNFGGGRAGIAVTVTVRDATGRAWTISRFVAEAGK